MSGSVPLGQFEILSSFKKQGLAFMDSLIEIFPEQPNLISARMLFENHLPIEDIMAKFSTRVLPNIKMIEERRDKFFLSEEDLFTGSKKDKLFDWAMLWKSKRLNNDDRIVLWQWIDVFVLLAQQWDANNKKLDNIKKQSGGD